MAQVNPYFTFNGNCEAAFEFYKSVFGGEYRDFNRFSEMPAQPGQELPVGAENLLMHVSLPISNETILMGSDAHPLMPAIAMGQNISISINAESRTETEKLFNGLSEKGTVIMPLEDTFWGAYFGMFTDQFGIHWMINFDAPKP